ncbi:response regulator transcription factor [Nocardiopsis potens]|uniref:response regulator transcription factor n=1 Tax=Nocardiopsis potens TaxID=1246458 RepID=UPI000475D71A|nr:response regulator transcription factor [Nocardiopsis potens]
MTIRVLIADDQPLIRAGFAAVIGPEADIEVAGEAATGDEAVDAVRRLVPDVVLMDIRMPGLDGIRAAERITGDPALHRVRVVILTTFDAEENMLAGLRAGAVGFLGKDVGPRGLLDAVRSVAAGGALLSPRATRSLIERYLATPMAASAAASDGRLSALTEREREVVALLGQGMSTEQIAETLFISPFTAKTHTNRAMGKLGARDRAHLVVIAYQAGLVRAGDPAP